MPALPSGTPLNLTAVTSVKPEPAIVTVVPAGPMPGPKELIRGSTWKLPLLWPAPEGVTTVSLPVEAAAGERTLKPALPPCTLPALPPPKPVPSTTTGLPGAAAPGAKPVIVGTAVKLVALLAVPPAVVTVIRPLVAAAGAWAVIWWSESTLALTSSTPLNLTAVTSVKPEPAMVTLAPAGALPGLTEVIRGS